MRNILRLLVLSLIPVSVSAQVPLLEPDTVLNLDKITLNGVGAGRSFDFLADNPDIDTGQAETLHTAGGTFPWSTFDAGPQSLEIVSASANDTANGTGARTARIVGLDADGHLQDIVVTMNGATPVSANGQWSHVYYLEVVTAGSGGTNAGNLTVQFAGGGSSVAVAYPSRSRSQSSAIKIPANYIGCVKWWKSFLDRTQTGSMRVDFEVRKPGETFVLRDRHELHGVNTSAMRSDYPGCLALGPSWDMQLTGRSTSTSNMGVYGQFSVILYKLKED